MVADDAVAILAKAEAGIRSLISHAASAGEYQFIDRLSVIGRQLAEMASEVSGVPEPAGSEPVGSSPTSKKSSLRTGRRTSRKSGYPRFARVRDSLIKIGWSKKERSEYQHKASRATVDTVAERVELLGMASRMFTADELLPAQGSDGLEDVPSYQAYICLAWLRHIGAVEQHGREGYTVGATGRIKAVVAEAWAALPALRR
jgi:hypothetical protein